MKSALLSLLLAAPVCAQIRAVEPVVLPTVGFSASAFGVVPSLGAPSALTPSLSASLAPSLPPAIAPALVPVAAPLEATPRAQAAVQIRALTAGVTRAAASMGDHAAPGDLAGAGQKIEALLTGALPAPSVESAPSTPEENEFALAATKSLAERADEIGSAKGLKAGTMTGGDFAGLLDEARKTAPKGPSPAADRAAAQVNAAIVRVVRALIPADQPLKQGLPRALAAWQVFDQEMAIAAQKGGLTAIEADAALFASQVEESVEPKVATPPYGGEVSPPHAVEKGPHPEDPEDYKSRSVEGSVFGWKPIEDSPGHGFAPFDWLIRRALAPKASPYSKGFDLPGASARATAKIFLYGERHTDGGLITENMRRIVEDAKAHKPMIVLVEGYTGWSLRGYEAVKYLADRGLDTDALTEKEIRIADVEVRGWDTATNYDASKHPLLQHHMDLLALNHLAHGELRGWAYYKAFAEAALVAIKGWRELWQAALVVRNGDLDRAVAAAVGDAAAHDATVHVVAGTDHLMQSPRLARVPWFGRPRLRATLRAALGGLPYWAGQPANTIP